MQFWDTVLLSFPRGMPQPVLPHNRWTAYVNTIAVGSILKTWRHLRSDLRSSENVAVRSDRNNLETAVSSKLGALSCRVFQQNGSSPNRAGNTAFAAVAVTPYRQYPKNSGNFECRVRIKPSEFNSFRYSCSTDNLGDEIIMQACLQEMRKVFPEAYIFRVATHEYMTNASRRLVRDSAFAFVCGTNLLSPHMIRPKWKLKPWDGLLLDNTILCGVGWCGYRPPADCYTRWLLNRILKNGAIHSVRDNYTISRIANLHHNLVNTVCPTMWVLDKRHCEAIPKLKTDVVVTTLNSWHPDPRGDRQWLATLTQQYRRVHFWPQTSQDIDYFASLGIGNIVRIPPSLSAYDDFLEKTNLPTMSDCGCTAASEPCKSSNGRLS